jgi:hypothetical protein
MKVLSEPVTIFEGSVEEFLKSPHEPVTIASFDFRGPVHASFLSNLLKLHTAEKFMVIGNFLQRREQRNPQTVLKTLSSLGRSLQAIVPETSGTRLGSELLRPDVRTDLDSHFLDVITGKTPINLAEARDEGMASALMFFSFGAEFMRAFEDLYAEVGISPPQFTQAERANFTGRAVRYIATMIEREFGKYSRLYSKLTPREETDEFGDVVAFWSRGKHGFLKFLAPVMEFCFAKPLLSNIQRYEYESENASSPYQTDVIVGYDWKSSFKDKHRDAYDFIRETLRVLGQHMNPGVVTIRLEKTGKPGEVLQHNYAGSTAIVTLALCVNGKPHSRVSLSSLQQLVNFCRQTIQSQAKANTTQELLARPRIKIEASS